VAPRFSAPPREKAFFPTFVTLPCIDKYLARHHSVDVADLSYDNWMTQLRKGLLELAILNTIAPAPLYGYEIVRRLSDVDHLVITEGTVYPILSRLKNSGLVETYLEESQEGPPRKYYRVTARGRDDLYRMNQHWDSLHDAIGGLRKERKR
jgi:PadR family transcriptional regulator, regulatory protein PadR